MGRMIRTVPAWLHRGLDVTDGLDSHTVLVVAVDELVLELTNLVNENTELVGNVGDVVIASLAPDGELLLEQMLGRVRTTGWQTAAELTATSMRSLPTSSMLRMTFFSILTSCDSFLARSGPKAPAADLRKVWPRGHQRRVLGS